MGVIVRRATVTDAEAIAAVHVLGWQQGYAGLLPESYLAALDVPSAIWSERLVHAPARSAVFVAGMGGRTVGFAGVGPALEAEQPESTELGHLYTLYVLSDHWGTGVGHRLHAAALAALRAEGFSEAMLWVLADNRRAIAFYERQGWQAEDVWREELLGGFSARERRYRHIF